MATPDIEQLRSLTDGAETFTDEQLQQILLTQGDVKHAAVFVWRSMAASFSALVDVSESGSSRKLGDLHKQALTMADNIAKDIAAEAVVVGSVKRSRPAGRR